ncbi:MAG: hypothetical protein M5U09_13000 [Gammaproteobacteria bacterium]|nr:hypothetical protein [Gammaproteobacteria bacterium]
MMRTTIWRLSRSARRRSTRPPRSSRSRIPDTVGGDSDTVRDSRARLVSPARAMAVRQTACGPVNPCSRASRRLW